MHLQMFSAKCQPFCFSLHVLTHWGRVTHICVVKLTIIGSDNGLAPGWRQAIIWTNSGILLIGPLITNFIENLIGIQTFAFKKMHLKMSSAKWRPFCLGLNVLREPFQLDGCCPIVRDQTKSRLVSPAPFSRVLIGWKEFQKEAADGWKTQNISMTKSQYCQCRHQIKIFKIL